MNYFSKCACKTSVTTADFILYCNYRHRTKLKKNLPIFTSLEQLYGLLYAQSQNMTYMCLLEIFEQLGQNKHDDLSELKGFETVKLKRFKRYRFPVSRLLERVAAGFYLSSSAAAACSARP